MGIDRAGGRGAARRRAAARAGARVAARVTAWCGAAVLVLGGLVAAPAASAASTTVTLSGPSSAYQGVSTTLTATWKVGGAAHRGTVALEQRVGSTWYRLGATTTGSAGTAAFHVAPRATSDFRAVTATGAHSAVAHLVIRSPYAVTLTATPGTVHPGSTTRLVARYTYRGKAVQSAATVTFQRTTSGSAAWSTLRAVTVATGGVAAYALAPGRTGAYRAVVPGRATSAAVTVRVQSTVPASFSVHGAGYGHGVGMPQFGAYAQALDGRGTSTILQSYYRGTSSGTVTTPTTVSVQVFGPEPYGYAPGAYSDTVSSTTVRIDRGWWRLMSAGGTALYTGPGPVTLSVRAGTSSVGVSFTSTSSGTQVTKSYLGTRFKVQWAGTRYYAPTSTSRGVATVAGAQGTYRNGDLSITAIGHVPNVVNEVLLNTEYLYGIAEVPSSWGLDGEASLEAQAIVARSYALTKLGGLRSACACNLVDDVRDQNYTGWKKQGETAGSTDYGAIWVRAVDDTTTSTTAARALTFGGEPVVAHYYSSSGGRTASSQDVWTATLPYEQSVSDPWSARAPGNTYRTWTRTLTQASARAMFGLPDVVRITVSKKYSSGQMAALTATSSTGTTRTVTGKPDALRARLGLPAAWVTSIVG
ncbi:SpoIID/LytB domain-containing protein [Luteimicrobium subarcticum]|uniref:SpoIID/LytB domain protein n=1 Tax=Luteimicrobium subarcticum TaxID=620910 RepID=A0A2M8WTQ7_9MICO|nr:SpoIID/LytB domain-containing protein [Luteimicrobium subarcticum]PJI94278.1 SpoIID/LytB domain protein [Luteimicrobium subarcticum]